MIISRIHGNHPWWSSSRITICLGVKNWFCLSACKHKLALSTTAKHEGKDRLKPAISKDYRFTLSESSKKYKATHLMNQNYSAIKSI